MKCPLFIVGNNAQPDPEQLGNDDCIREECAWWNPSLELCSMRTISWTLAAFKNIMDKLLEKMPQDKRTRRRP